MVGYNPVSFNIDKNPYITRSPWYSNSSNVPCEIEFISWHKGCQYFNDWLCFKVANMICSDQDDSKDDISEVHSLNWLP